MGETFAKRMTGGENRHLHDESACLGYGIPYSECDILPHKFFNYLAEAVLIAMVKLIGMITEYDLRSPRSSGCT